MNNKSPSLEDRIIFVLKSIFDPEISVDIYELGLIYDVKIYEKDKVKIVMTLTTPNCPVADSLPLEVKRKVQSIQEIKEVDVILTFDPPWSREFMSDEARLELGLL
ncbi:iron-sulfur cluster assembly protein [Blattabacterium cuenoti]|uniref:Fes assembly suf system protein n=1 Tax=Blattabacterium cuenoti STAT TaxID=1457030 RepID=A0A224AAW6_9FLAO|nr:iron-sulfur cluster assembly protein [Blattabacterium cuenoti]BBA16997.1 fes assembly suf system protein [Blattabacterium cuenoti STAT]